MYLYRLVKKKITPQFFNSIWYPWFIFFLFNKKHIWLLSRSFRKLLSLRPRRLPYSQYHVLRYKNICAFLTFYHLHIYVFEDNWPQWKRHHHLYWFSYTNTQLFLWSSWFLYYEIPLIPSWYWGLTLFNDLQISAGGRLYKWHQVSTVTTRSGATLRDALRELNIAQWFET